MAVRMEVLEFSDHGGRCRTEGCHQILRVVVQDAFSFQLMVGK
jgi:hypothetical protein